MTTPQMLPIDVQPRHAFDWAAVAARCREEPGTWFAVLDAPPNATSWQVRHGLLAAMRPVGHYDARRVDGSLCVVFNGAPNEA